MNIYQNLVERALPLARAKRIKKICVGINYTIVEIEKGGTGLVYTFRDTERIYELGEEINFWNASADIVIKGYLSHNPIEISVGLATINAIFADKKENLKNAILGDIFSEIKFSPTDEILMIGYFESLFKKLEGRVKKIWVIEKNSENAEFTIKDLANKVNLVLITSSTLINKTLEDILKDVEGVPEVLLIGPATPLNPEIFRFTPVTWLCGIVVKDSETLFKKVCEGKGITAFFKSGAIEKINLRIKK
ncbi:MAG: hypothetical protein DRP29_06900 [Thermodesulfobacteriota bacterium]|nr:MAG: hypothetical protein DRP29_06900 [Thermodesulfobacteriota bacterium]RLG13164.1 MAG: hypothetical protein DRN73_00115 [Candidatus Pacearchaeota archaeon]